MAKRKQTPNTPGEQIAQQILSHYEKNERAAGCDNARNGYSEKRSKHRWARFLSVFPATVRAPLSRR